MKKYILTIPLISLIGCSNNNSEIQSLCIGKVIEERGDYFCVQEINNAFCMINIVQQEDNTNGIMINCGTIEPRESIAFCASTNIKTTTTSNGTIYHCDNNVGFNDIISCEYIIDNTAIINGAKKDMKMGEVRCRSKKNIDMHHNPL